MAGSTAGAGGADACVTDVMAAGRDMTCASCLCTMCAPELTAVDGDTKADAMLSCISTNNCTGTCCLCNLPDCNTDLNMFGAGPCGDEIQTAAGLTPMLGLPGAIANGTMVADNCNAMTSPATSSCGNSARLGACLTMNCMTECPSTATCN